MNEKEFDALYDLQFRLCEESVKLHAKELGLNLDEDEITELADDLRTELEVDPEYNAAYQKCVDSIFEDQK